MEDIERAADVVLNGGVVLHPTDTVFGLSANVFDKTAVEKIYQIKKRNLKKPLPVLVAEYTDLLKLVETPSRLEGKIIEAFWPGPLTIVLKKKKNVESLAFSGKDTIAVRMPNSELVRNLIRETGTPLATTSANLAGKEDSGKFNEIDEEVKSSVDFILDNPEETKTPSGLASTIVQVIDGEIKILREGAISEEDIKNRLRSVN